MFYLSKREFLPGPAGGSQDPYIIIWVSALIVNRFHLLVHEPQVRTHLGLFNSSKDKGEQLPNFSHNLCRPSTILSAGVLLSLINSLCPSYCRCTTQAVGHAPINYLQITDLLSTHRQCLCHITNLQCSSSTLLPPTELSPPTSRCQSLTRWPINEYFPHLVNSFLKKVPTVYLLGPLPIIFTVPLE